MHIKQIELQGFKSYGERVVIKGFDKQFNAITGLNGTGKSNILDAICFVLGMSNLSNVRAGSLQELIYKQGQAGVNKATVSITFDNSDPDGSPVGYENTEEIVVTRQVVMGGKNKYLINGSQVQNKKVSDLFCSVQLNVNNPHFLIMQGRITKVANMKPPEILAMVEEAAGTRMYETKRRAAEATIEKKDAKLRELGAIISEEIAPRLQRLQDERSQYQEYQKATRELDSLSRLHVAYVYTATKERADTAKNKLTQLEDEIGNKKAEHEQAKADIERVRKEEAELASRLDEAGGGQVCAAENALEAAEAEQRKCAGVVREAEDDLVEHDRAVDGVKRRMQEDETTLADRRRNVDKVSGVFERLKSACTSTEQAVKDAEHRFLVACGLPVENEGAASTLRQTQKDTEERRKTAAEEALELGLKREQLEAQLKDIARAADIDEKRASQERADERRLEQDEKRLANELAAIKYDPAEHAELRERVTELQNRERTLRSSAERPRAQLQRADFQYSDPVSGFDRSKVRGVLCRLVRAPDERYFLALQAVAGAKLFNVVVDTSDTGRLILKNGKLTRHTTFIPLNNISGDRIDDRTARLAKQVAGDRNGDKVRTALELIEYPSDVSRAVQWVFGTTFVCDNLNTARKIAFHNQIKRRCVTLDGDVCDPGGLMSGGAPIQEAPVLRQVRELDAIESQLEAASTQLADALRRLRELDALEEDYHNVRARHHQAKVALEELRKRLVASGRATQVREELRTKLKDTTAAEKVAIKRRDEADARLADIEVQLRDQKGHREKECEEAETALNLAKEKAERARQAWDAREREYSMMHLEIEGLVRAVDEGRAKLAELDVTRARLLAALEQARIPLEEATRLAEEARRVLTARQEEATGRNVALLKLQRDRADRQAAADDARLKLQELSYSKKDLDNDVAAQNEKMKKMEREHTWIKEDRVEFGREGGPYDFEARDARTVGARLEQLKARRERLSRGLNARAHTLLTKEEEQYQDLANKRRIVESDRANLVQVMRNLDETKRRALLTAVERVSHDFADIFAALLPGAAARLRPPPGSTELEGLEVGVAFNGVWKRSLDELSGGQRSLVMLSLVLAMLRFKPAPLYILDEVDAALDLSHTQNMGAMMRRHFSTSQFIVVSLKEGMFDNANVLFRTRFVDGFSTVERTVRQQRAREHDERNRQLASR